jgi:hypothetical protein
MDAYVTVTWIFRNLWKILTIFVIIVVLLIKYLKSSSWLVLLGLFLSLEGTALLGSAFTPPVNELAANGGFKKFITNCIQYDYPVKFNPVLFFSGIFSLLIGTILTTLF